MICPTKETYFPVLWPSLWNKSKESNYDILPFPSRNGCILRKSMLTKVTNRRLMLISFLVAIYASSSRLIAWDVSAVRVGWKQTCCWLRESASRIIMLSILYFPLHLYPAMDIIILWSLRSRNARNPNAHTSDDRIEWIPVPGNYRFAAVEGGFESRQ